MAPCVIIGERAAEIIRNSHQIGTMLMENNSTKNSTVLVVGATGVLGMEVCRQLAAAGKKVKGLVRTPSQKEKVNGLHELGVETVTGDMKDLQSLYQAFQNVDAIISTATSTISHQEGDSIETVDLAGQLNVADAASGVGVQHVVFISFPPFPPMTPEFPLQSAKRAVEDRLKSKNFTYTILQPTYFMEIWLGPVLGFDCAHAKAVIYGQGKNKISWIAIKDVASFAVASIDNPAAQNAVIQLGGPDDLSVLDVVGIFEQESGQTFELQNVPDEALRAQMAAAPGSRGKTFSGLMIGLNEVGTIDMKEHLRNFPIQLTSVREYARQLIAAEAKEAGVAVGLHSVSEGQHNFISGREPYLKSTSQLSSGTIPAIKALVSKG
jgi:NADH dehydrogenase